MLLMWSLYRSPDRVATMLCEDGRRKIHWTGRYQKVIEPCRLLFTIADRPDEDVAELVTVVLRDLGDGRTEMRFEQRGRMSPVEYERARRGLANVLRPDRGPRRRTPLRRLAWTMWNAESITAWHSACGA
ncbi:MAG: SRPBCC domain-containing protein [Actinomycetota bacterium]|nr:SRPBCC domain-containing protein [Actinomycetota bacterium]